MPLSAPLAMLPLLVPTPLSASALLGLSTPPLHLTLAADMTGSSKNPAFGYASQARLLAQSVLLNQVRSGDTVTLLRICQGVQTVADFRFQSKNGARMGKADILRYTNALTQPCVGRGSAITAGLNQAVTAAKRTAGVGNVTVLFTDGAVLDDPKRAALEETVGRLLGLKDAQLLFVAGLSPEKGSGGTSIRDHFMKALGNGANHSHLLTAGAYDLNNVYPTFADLVKKARK
ncbi:VWA domain-containing protein [Deinococcus hopiensis]|uniref:von Willebrand factor type A domain-containing protein n=1 Tax=Deinococcus hopiensis KR-140 TaxID=695939 RepID=A0A1W1VIB4_9DEIO|nr:VWA domain-containing protein [Deinococcus hopiensis]SMB93068.1 von Willebrand factor type A domain-containing protein [Deinococcus hopiensis KR-140]